MNKRKLGALIATIALIAAIAVGGTLAYFTDKDTNSNVVKMGHVDISLTETSSSQKATTITDKGITFTSVLPGDTLNKIPTVTVQSGSADCYIRVKLGYETNISDANMALLNANLQNQITAGGTWAYNTTDGYYYCTAVKAAGDKVDLFQNVVIPTAWDNSVADQSFTINLTAEAIQASYIGYDAAGHQWTGADGQPLTVPEIQAYVAK